LSDQAKLDGATVSRVFTYSMAAMLKTVSIDGALVATYTHDARNLRTKKVLANPPPGTPATTLYRYDPEGRLTEEIAGSGPSVGQTLVTYVWQDDIPVAVIYAAGTSSNPGSTERIVYLHADHLNTPRKASDSQGRIVWKWESDAFGASAPNEDPGAMGQKTVVNLRFPGQYFDAESGLHSNWNRYYDPGVGRYTQSDPIGLAGGINTYAYVGGNPISRVDPLGLATCVYSVSTGRMDCMRNGSEKFTWSRTFASGNNKEAGCKNNSNCETKAGIGPIPRGCYAWSGPGSSGKPGGRALTPLPPLQSMPFGRDLFRSHSCDNPFGSSLGPKFCSEGCVTGTRATVAELNDFIDSESSVLCVVD
jgi:RHS repeat-associated protein